jgi:hypothetical protein
MTRVETLGQLYLARVKRQAIICPNHRAWKKPRPAAFMMNLSGEILYRLFAGGMYIYEKPNIGEKP